MKIVRNEGLKIIGWAFVMLPFACLTFAGIQGYGILDALRWVFPLITFFLFALGIRGVWIGTSRKAYERDVRRENETNELHR